MIPLAAEGDDNCQLPIEEKLYARRPDKLPGRYYTAADYHQLYKDGKLSPVDVVEALAPYVVRGDPKDAKREYQVAWTYGDIDAALAKAKECEARYRTGKPLGILDGVPVAVKDDCDVKGYRTCKGMPPQDGCEFFNPVTKTAWPVQKLEEAGAVVVGKCAMHQLGSDTSGCNVSPYRYVYMVFLKLFSSVPNRRL